ncbi:hypothetical protein EFK50_03485 [Nocardioides marmoriginsengisoli]|uniref:Uncharacterized protein n=1 Tax=Nocardioides marmoriginsengisoli TaxID=661483 RepID=A0A3N0CP01_9ACTN|nr:hypothetical protein [Nocardioides marmoriginsengisoli]RNL65049.1 hypothetical protein EFK50_03485 [Nocardioides marmoriginsengisoli]
MSTIVYHRAVRVLWGAMSILHSYVEAAVRRDLTRARLLLTAGARLSTVRRRAIAEHLVWLCGLTELGTALISPAAVGLREAAVVFGDTGMAPDRDDLIKRLDVFLRVTAAHPGSWTAPDAARIACRNLPWVLDALVVRGGPGLVLPRIEAPEVARTRAAEYRRKRSMLWGPVALASPETLDGVPG